MEDYNQRGGFPTGTHIYRSTIWSGCPTGRHVWRSIIKQGSAIKVDMYGGLQSKREVVAKTEMHGRA